MTEFQYLDDGNSEAQDRLATSFLFAQTSPGLATTGVLSGLAVSQTTTASSAVLVAVGSAPVQASVGTGVAFLVNDTLKTLDVLTANPVGGLPRNDIVVFDSVTKALIAIVGTPNALPNDPTVPATACVLARLRHAASATTIPAAKIDDLRVFTKPFATPARSASAGMPGAPVTTTGTLVDVATPFALTALPYPTLVHVSWAALLQSTTTIADEITVTVGLGALKQRVQRTYGVGEFPFGGSFTVQVPANTVVTPITLRGSKAGAGTATFSNDPAYTDLSVVQVPA